MRFAARASAHPGRARIRGHCAAEATGIFESDEGLVEKITTLGQPAPERLPRSDPFDRAIKIQGRPAARPPRSEKSVTIRGQGQSNRRSVKSGFFRLGQWVARHPRVVLLGWIVAITLGAIGAHKLPTVAIGGTAGIPGSPSIAAADALRSQFSNPFIDPLVIAVSAPRLDVDRAPYLTWVRAAARALGALPSVRRVADYSTTHDARDALRRRPRDHSCSSAWPPPTRKASSARSFRCARPSPRCVPSSSGSMPQPRSR